VKKQLMLVRFRLLHPSTSGGKVRWNLSGGYSRLLHPSTSGGKVQVEPVCSTVILVAEIFYNY
jgi:hypothetical protein